MALKKVPDPDQISQIRLELGQMKLELADDDLRL